MRCIGYLENEEAANTFRDFLYVEGMPGHVEHDDAHGWAIWVEAEDQLAAAGDWLARFRANPRDPAFKQKAREAPSLRQQAEKSDAAYARKMKDRSEVFRPIVFAGAGPLTLTLIGVSVLVFILMLSAGGGNVVAQYLTFSQASRGMPEILHGELWRLLTPVFIHFGILHIFFNMLWLRDLGGMIEVRQGTGRLLGLVLGVGIAGNLAQYFAGPWLLHLAASSPSPALAQSFAHVGKSLGDGLNFGGMSGVNYGLLGYIWLRGRLDPGSGLFLHSYTVGFMLVWLVLCFTGMLGPIANAAHLAGLLAGAWWGWITSFKHR